MLKVDAIDIFLVCSLAKINHKRWKKIESFSECSRNGGILLTNNRKTRVPARLQYILTYIVMIFTGISSRDSDRTGQNFTKENVAADKVQCMPASIFDPI